jgi:hypothetical protein
VAIDTTAPRSRRAILAGALGGAGALIATAIGRAAPVSAATGDNVVAGQDTTAGAPTAVLSDQAVTDGITGTALEGDSATGIGVLGVSDAPGSGRSTGVVGLTGGEGALDANLNLDSVGVYGFSDDDAASAGVWGDTFQGIGVVGTGDFGVLGVGSVGAIGQASDSSGSGVYGFSGDLASDEAAPFPAPGTGVVGYAGAGGSTGVRGHAFAGSTYGVYASAANSTTQYALFVSGKVRLSRSGRVAVSSSATSKAVSMTGVTTSSYVVATLQTNVSGCYVRAVVPSTNKFTIYLSKAPGKTAYVGYVVVN